MDLGPLRAWNPHWYGGPISPRILKHPRPRAMVVPWLDEILNPADDLWALKPGPRQVGKTTSLGHVAKLLLERPGIEPRRVALAPLDDESIREASGGRLEAIVEATTSLAAPAPGKPNFLLLDEVQAFPDWSAQLKTAWDRHHRQLRVLATGSSALRLIRPVEADFHGRLRTVQVHPMKFREVLLARPDLDMHMESGTPDRLWAHVEECRRALPEGHEAFGNALGELYGFVEGRGLSDIVEQTWLEYCAWGGYPATRPGVDLSPAQRLDRIEAALNTVLARDVVAGGVRKLREFRLLLRHIAVNPGGKFEPFGVGRRLDTEGDTIREWKQILEDVMVVHQLAPLKPDFRAARGRDKAYPMDPAWTSYFRGHALPAVDADDPTLGPIAESVLVDHARRLQFNVTGTSGLPVGYVARPEVDVAFSVGRRWVLLESKQSRNPQVRLQGVGPRDAVRVIATRDDFDPGGPGSAIFVPAAVFALVC